ncbi:MAG: hypothetical protein Q4D07_05750, partial [Selenomonadaceae bacterium]|nr:hypothetical protein [Selenomonadaceae bacterium]
PEPEPEIISEPEPEIIPEPEPVKPATGSFVIGPGGFSFVIPDKIEEPAKPVPEPTPEPMPETAEIVPEPEPEIVSVPEPEVIPETAPEPEIAPEPNLKPEIPADKLAGLTTLDDFLDYAYSEKDTGNLPLAAAALAMAVERFGDNSYAPFVVIELANVYKSQGNYEAAIKAYQEAYSLPAVAADEFAAAQFRSSEEYLTKLMTVLEKHGKPGLSFTEIPEDYFREIL